MMTQAAAFGLAAVMAGSAVFGLGLAPVTNLIVGTVLGSAPPQRAGAASGLSETTTEFGGALGIAILGSIATAVYHYRESSRIPPGTPARVASSISSTLGDATAAAGQVPRSSAGILESARAAFTSGLSVAAGISAAIAAVLAVVALARLRRT